jgi:hypothetical protein
MKKIRDGCSGLGSSCNHKMNIFCLLFLKYRQITANYFFFPCLKLTGLRKKLVTLKWEDNNYSTVEISGLDIGWGQVRDVKAYISFCIMFKPFKHFYLFIFISLSFSRGYL